MVKFLFLFSILVVFYSYIGYGILLYLLLKIKRLFSPKISRTSMTGDFEPEVSLVVSAYNEEDFIERKIKNSLEIDYPAGKLRWIFITDGSNDGTPEIIAALPQILFFTSRKEKGKWLP